MSALTDLFTALANKIRSKTGTATTYTPPQMVSSGIDDVYNAGVAAGTPTLTGDAAASNVLSGKTFYNTTTTKQTGSMTNNGAVSQALNCGESYTVPEGYHNGSGTVTANSLASQTGVDSGKTAIDALHVQSGYQGWVNGNKISGSYNPVIATTIVPGTTPSQVTKNNTYNISTNNGYIIKDYESLYASSDGAYFTAGMIQAQNNGYAYLQKPTGGFTETTLWTNSSPTASSGFAAQTITLSQSVDNFDYIGIKYATYNTKTTTDSAIATNIRSVADFKKSAETAYYPSFLLGYYGSSTRYQRRVKYVSTTQIGFTASQVANASGTDNKSNIPLYVYGLKFTP